MTASPYAALKIPDYRMLLVGRLFANLALQIQGLAVGWQIYALTKDPLFLGLAGLAEVLPSISISLYAGHVADILDRKKIAIFACGSLLLCLILLSLSSYTIAVPNHLNQTSIFSYAIAVPPRLALIIYFLIALTGLARGFYGPALFGLVSDIVAPEHYGNAAAWNTTLWQMSAVGGPVIGGFLYVWLGPSATYVVTAILMFCGFLCFFRIKSSSRIEKQEKRSVAQNIAEGLKFVFSNEIVLGAMALDLFAVLFGGAVALLPIFASEVFHSGPQALGLLRAAPSIGALITAAILTHKPVRRHTGRIFMLSVAGFGLCIIGFGLSTSFYLSMFLLAISGALDGISIWIRTTIYQLVTPHNMKGRVAAVNSIFIGSSNEIGEFESGVTAKIMGLVPSVVFGGCMTLLVVLFTMIRAPKLCQLHIDSLYKSED
jgi:MFS family permease